MQFLDFTPLEDPYFSGDGDLPTAPRPPGYTLDPIAQLTSQRVPERTLRIPNAFDPDRLEAALGPRAKYGKTVGNVGSGAVSNVYSYADSRPPRGLVGKKADAWLKGNSAEAVKVRQANRSGSAANAEQAARDLRKDLALYDVATQLTAKAKYNGESFIRVAELRSGDPEHAVGIMRQEMVPGPKVYDLQLALECATNIPACKQQFRAHPEHFEARMETLRSAKLLEPGQTHVDPARLTDVQTRITALEYFYRDTHTSVQAFIGANDMDVAVNSPKPGQHAKAVGLDYNHGHNVIFDPRTGGFVLIDW
jgi:hypothetical protein